jgi:hypothetical protein
MFVSIVSLRLTLSFITFIQIIKVAFLSILKTSVNNPNLVFIKLVPFVFILLLTIKHLICLAINSYHSSFSVCYQSTTLNYSIYLLNSCYSILTVNIIVLMFLFVRTKLCTIF